MKGLVESIKANSEAHGSIPFWSWNDKLNEDELRRQIRNMKELGMRGFFMHARGGLETEYMSDEWFSAINACLEEARKLDMEAWSYDENGWPSGFGGGALLNDPANFAKSISLKEFDEFPENEENIIAIYTIVDKKLNRVTSPCRANKYYAVIKEFDFSYVDTLDGNVTEKFIKSTHEIYAAKIDSSNFGTIMPGFFTDEPQYFRWGTPWSDTFYENFKKRFEYDVTDGLAHLFIDGLDGGYEFRYDYRLLCHEQYYENFMKKIYDWCCNNGVKLTGHGVEEWTLGGQMMCCGGVMPFYLYEHIPGIDYLARDIKDMSGIKQLGSVCAQTSKKYALSEMYACCGWDVTPKEIKRITDLQYAGGVNLICEHLYAYSERGQRKRDYPNHYSEHNPWQKYYSLYERHYKNLGSALSHGKEFADTLVLHPIRSVYAHYPRNYKILDEKFSELVKQLSLDHITYHFGDETVMKLMGKVVGNKIKLGSCEYDKIIVPNIETIDSSTASLLKEYLENGGKLCILGEVPNRIDGRIADLSFIKATITYDKIKEESLISIKQKGIDIPLEMQLRETEYGKIIFVANVSEKEYYNTEITVKNVSSLCIFDIDSLEYKKIRGKKNKDGSITVLYDFKDSESILIIETELEMLPFVFSEKKSAIKLGKFRLDDLPENVMTLSEAKISKNGGAFTETRPVVRIRDNLLKERFEGLITMMFSFEAEYIPKKLYVVVEPMKYTEVKINEEAVSFIDGYRFDRSFKLVDITKYVKLGENSVCLTFEYKQSENVYRVLYGGGNEALRNCLAFDTEIEDIYLYGDFGVRSLSEFTVVNCEPIVYRTKGPFIITNRNNEIDLTDIVNGGYPFFAGEMSASTVLNYTMGDPTTAYLYGRYAVCKIAVNSQILDTDIFTNEFDLSNYLKEGENTITLTLCFSNRNFLGPHNCIEAEPKNVNPDLFSFENKWDGENCSEYVSQKSFVKFGI